MSQILTHNEHEKYCSDNSLPKGGFAGFSSPSSSPSGKLRFLGLVYIALLRSHLAVSFFGCRKRGGKVEKKKKQSVMTQITFLRA